MFKIEKDGFEVYKLKTEIEGIIAPIYVMGLPGDIEKLENSIKDLMEMFGVSIGDD